LTFITTPLTLFFYPPRYRDHIGGAAETAILPGTGSVPPADENMRSKFAVILDSMEQLPPAMTLTQLLKPLSTSVRPSLPEKFSEKSPTEKSSQSEASVIPGPTNTCTVSVDAIRLVEWTERTSAVLKSQSVDTLIRNDAVLSIFRTFGRLNNFSMSSFLSVLSHDEFSNHVANHVRERGSQMVIIPWSLASHDVAETSTSHHTGLHPSPFDFLFSKPPGKDEAASLLLRSQFIRRVFANSPSDVALVIDRGLSTDSGSTIYPHIFLPFFGGPDDRIALSFVVQLCMHEAVSATIVRMDEAESDGRESVATVGNKSVTNAEGALFPNTVYSQQGTQVRINSDTADNILWDRVTSQNSSTSADVRSASRRISFRRETAVRRLHRVLELAGSEASQTSKPLLVVTGRSRRMVVESHKRELDRLVQERNSSLPSDVSKTFGAVASAFVVAGGGVSLVVMQASLL